MKFTLCDTAVIVAQLRRKESEGDIFHLVGTEDSVKLTLGTGRNLLYRKGRDMTEQLDLSDGDTQTTFSVEDLTTVDGDDAHAAFSRLVEHAGGPAAIERITVVTPGRIPSSNPAFTEAASANGIDPDRLSFVHPGDYVPALGSVSGPDHSPVPSPRPNGYATFEQTPQRIPAESHNGQDAPQEDTRLLAAFYKEPGSDTPNAMGIVFTSVIAIVLVVVLFVLVTAFS